MELLVWSGFGSVLGGLWGSPGAAKTLHFPLNGVQNQTLGELDANIVLRSGSEQVLGGFGQQKRRARM